MIEGVAAVARDDRATMPRGSDRDGNASPAAGWMMAEGLATRGPRLPVWSVYVLGIALIAIALALPWGLRWSGLVRGEAPARHEPEPVSPRTLRPVMIRLPAGEFTMGSPAGEGASDEKPQRRVLISSFDLCQTEVTQEQFQAVMGHNPSSCEYGCGPNLPVQTVTWDMATEYLNRLTGIDNKLRAPDQQLIPCYERSDDTVLWVQGCTGYRLPTEAEWEYAARARSTNAYGFGDDAAELGDHAWYGENAGDEVHPVGTAKKRNAHPWGLYDMHGNVWEWVWDWYAPYEAATGVIRNPRGPPAGDPGMEPHRQ